MGGQGRTTPFICASNVPYARSWLQKNGKAGPKGVASPSKIEP